MIALFAALTLAVLGVALLRPLARLLGWKAKS
jgi:hypothetical protein